MLHDMMHSADDDTAPDCMQSPGSDSLQAQMLSPELLLQTSCDSANIASNFRPNSSPIKCRFSDGYIYSSFDEDCLNKDGIPSNSVTLATYSSHSIIFIEEPASEPALKEEKNWCWVTVVIDQQKMLSQNCFSHLTAFEINSYVEYFKVETIVEQNQSNPKAAQL